MLYSIMYQNINYIYFDVVLCEIGNSNPRLSFRVMRVPSKGLEGSPSLI